MKSDGDEDPKVDADAPDESGPEQDLKGKDRTDYRASSWDPDEASLRAFQTPPLGSVETDYPERDPSPPKIQQGSRFEELSARATPKPSASSPRSEGARPGALRPPIRNFEEEPARRSLWVTILLWGTGSLFLLTVLGALAIIFTVSHFSRDLPDVRDLEKNYSPQQVTRILARDGTLLANIFSERRTVVPFARIPDHVKSAFLAAEDAGFFQHEGLDYLGLVRAMAVNLRAGHVKQGGSTITQQVVKNVLLDHERSYQRKIRETILAYRLEQNLTKEQILGMYMNHIYLGHGRYGVEEAGRYLFGKHVEELTVADAALLAGIVASPERYSPRKSLEKALIRRKFVLGQMLKKGFMVPEVYEAALKVPIRLAPAVETESDIAPETVGHARRILEQIVGEGARKGGYTVRTTIDPELQVQARQALRTGLDAYLKRQHLAPPYTLEKRRLWGKVFSGTPKRYGIYVGTVQTRDDEKGQVIVQVGDRTGFLDLKHEERFNPTHLSATDFVGENAILRVRVVDDPAVGQKDELLHLRLELGPQAALVALDPQTREVLAAVGSYEALPGGLDRTIQTRRQPGSTFKPLIYSYALNSHQVTAATSFEFPLDVKKRSATSTPQADSEGLKAEDPPTEHLSLRDGIARSDNRVAEQVFRTVGGEQAVGWAQALGIRSPMAPDASLMLGAYEMTVTEMAGAFAVFASGGTALDPVFISQVESGSGPTTLPPRAPSRRVMEPDVAYLVTDLLSSVVERGTAKAASSLGRPLAGKTGTTNQAKDAWFVGYSTDLVVAVWVGYDDALPLGWGESGATAALPIWMEFIKSSHKTKSPTQFPRPAGISDVLVDPRSGLLARYGQEDAVSEIFLKGTEPTEVAPEPEDGEGLEPDSNEQVNEDGDAMEETGEGIAAGSQADSDSGDSERPLVGPKNEADEALSPDVQVGATGTGSEAAPPPPPPLEQPPPF